MKIAEVRELNSEELSARVKALKRELFDLRMRRAEGKLTAPHRIRQARREAAQVLGVLRERELGQAEVAK